MKKSYKMQQRPVIDLTSLYEILQTSGFLHNVYKIFEQLQDHEFFYDMFQNYGQFLYNT